MSRAKYDLMEGVESADGGRIVANNTIRYTTTAGDTVIRLHDTDIVVYWSDGTISLNSGGWQTVTTKDRMNRALAGDYRPGAPIPWQNRPAISWSVGSDKGAWYLWKRNRNPERYSGKWEPFADGMRFDPVTGRVQGAGDPAEQAEIRKLVTTFARKIRTADSLPEPNNGDCWGCLMRADDGSYPMGADCLLEHCREGYIHGSLILRAMRWAGYQDMGIQIHTGWGGINGPRLPSRPFDAPARAVKRYILRQNGLAA